jgi:hypothetical protein
MEREHTLGSDLHRRSGGVSLAALEQARVEPAVLRDSLADEDDAVALAAALQLGERLRAGEDLDVPALLPADPFALPPEAQLVLARLAEAGYAVPAPNPPPHLAPLVRLAWLRAHLLAAPANLEAWGDSPLGWAAVVDLPEERVVASGLLQHLAGSADATFRDASVGYLRAGVSAGLVAPVDAHAILERLAADTHAAVALAALELLRGPWSFDTRLPYLSLGNEDLQLDLARIALWEARRLPEPLRAALASPDLSPPLVARVLLALGNVGDAADVRSIAGEMRSAGDGMGNAGFQALLAAKRRGFSVDDDDAVALAALALSGPASNMQRVAEVLSSRSDRIVAAWDAGPWDDALAAPKVALLEAFGTRAAIARLREVLHRPRERSGLPYAMEALGRLGDDDAEEAILQRFDEEPDAALVALGYLGGARTVTFLSARLDTVEPPAWSTAAAVLVFQLAPSTSLFEALSTRGALDRAVLDAIPAQGACTDALSRLATVPGHPLRAPAIHALGRTGGPMAMSVLGGMLDDPDEEIRGETSAAVRTLGHGLAAQGALRPPGLRDAADPGATMLAHALVARLAEPELPLTSVTRLLDALAAILTQVAPAWRAPARFVPVVRAYLRRRAPEVRKRAIACLAAAGGSAIAWLLPALEEDDVTVARQALLALTSLGAVGVAARVARWLHQPNMNLKKTAAEALAVVGDASVVGELVGWLSSHDNPGLRAALLGALRHILGGFHRGVLVEALVGAETVRERELCALAMSGEWTPDEMAALVRVRGDGGRAPWCALFLRRVYDGAVKPKSGSLLDLDAALRTRGIVNPVTSTSVAEDEPLRTTVHGLRAGIALRDALRARPAGTETTAAIRTALPPANARGNFVLAPLSRAEVRRLIEVYPHLDPEERAAARSVLERCELDPVSALRLARGLGYDAWAHEPSSLLRVWADTLTLDRARTLAESPNGAARHAAWQTLLLSDESMSLSAPMNEAQRWLDAVIRRNGSGDAWAARHRQFPMLFRTLARLAGTRAAVSHARRRMIEHPETHDLLPAELARVAEAGVELLEELALGGAVSLRVREVAAAQLARTAAPPFLRALLEEGHASLREIAAEALLERGSPADRRRILEDYLSGRLRTSFVPRVRREDIEALRLAPLPVEGDEALRFISLADEMARVAPTVAAERLLELWRIPDARTRTRARDALRRLGTGPVLPFVRKALKEGSTSVLDVLAAGHSLSPELTGYLRAQGATDAWVEYLERCAGGGVLHAPGLASLLADHLGDERRARVLALFLRLADWNDPSSVPGLLSLLEPELAGDARASVLRQLVEATERLDLPLRGRVLAKALRPGDEAALPALVDALVGGAELSLSPALGRAVEQAMQDALRGEPERARRILAFLGARAGTEPERDAFLGALEGAMAHPSPRVRLYAHRLLRSHAPRARYLVATRALLDDADEATVRAAVRALAHGGDLESVDAIASLLGHGHPLLRRAAEEGLVVLGEAASPRLRKAMGRARPDHRDAYAKVLARIERAAELAKPTRARRTI